MTIIEERTVGPSLGRDSIRSGLVAGIAGFLGVMLFMLLYYRLSGVNAVVALALNVLLVFGALGALPFLFSAAGSRATLTLPGIAGLILTVGMAVDSNVLIFERIREELRLGKTVRSAVDQGFGKAFTDDSGLQRDDRWSRRSSSSSTAPARCRGFAVTLTIGLLASMFTAVFVSRQLFELVLLRIRPDRDAQHLKSDEVRIVFQILKDPNFDFMGKRNVVLAAVDRPRPGGRWSFCSSTD